jgi:imidazolonepropionase-like amidohydrolase
LQVLPGSSPIFGGRAIIVHPIQAPTVAAMKVPGAPQGFKMACGENPKSQDADAKEAHGPTSRQGEVAFVREAFMEAQDYRDAWNLYAAGKAATPPKRDLKKEALAGILAGDIHIAMHCYRSDDMATMLAVAREFGFTIGSFHHAVEAYKIPALLRTAGTGAAVWGDWWGYKMEALDGVRADAALLDRAGVTVAMHSDSSLTGQRLNIEAAKAAGAARALGIDIPPERMIRWVTSNPARLLFMGDRIGTLAPGYDADLVVWSGNPFSVYTRADLVVIDGAVAFDRSAPPAHSPSDFELGRTGAPRP